MAGVWTGKLSGIAGFERLVAIKIIHQQIASESSFVKMFLDEARLAAQIHHPNVCEIMDVGKEEDGLLFMVGELVMGQSLRSLFRSATLKGVKIPHAISAEIISKVCLGLHAAHELKDAHGKTLGLVHRDISKRNILLSYDGFVKLIDFGIAMARGRMTKTDVGTLKGNIIYMSPEHVTNEIIDRRSDIFSLGVVLYTMVTGKQPFQGESEAAVLYKIANGTFVLPGEIAKTLDPDLERIIIKAMARMPDDRYSSAAMMHDDLETYIKSTTLNVSAKTLSSLMHNLFSKEYEKLQKQLNEPRQPVKGTVKSDDIENISKKPVVTNLPDSDNLGGDYTVAATPQAISGKKDKKPKGVSIKTMSAVAAVLVVAVILGVLFMNGSDKAQPASTSNKIPDSAAKAPKPEAASGQIPAVIKEPANVRISLNISPKNASIKLDGEQIETGSTTLNVHRDGQIHEIEFYHAGYVAHTETFEADSDKTITVELKALKKKRMKRKKKQRRINKTGELKRSPYR